MTANPGMFPARRRSYPFLHSLYLMFEARVRNVVIGSKMLSGLGLIYCAGERVLHFPDHFRHIASAILLGRSNK